MDPEYDIDIGIILGADMVRESLRRIYVWKHCGESDGVEGDECPTVNINTSYIIHIIYNNTCAKEIRIGGKIHLSERIT